MLGQLNQQPTILDERPPTWQTTLWREWCRTQDEDYAYYLFDLVKSTALGWKFVAAIAALGGVGGLLAGYVLGSILTANVSMQLGPWLVGRLEFGPFNLSGVLLTLLTWGLGLAGGIFGVLASRKYRVWYFWWQGQPSASRVERALRQAAEQHPGAKEVWTDPLARLERLKSQELTPEQVINLFNSPDWQDRFAARKALVSRGGEVTGALQAVAADRLNPLWQTAIWLLTAIEQETANAYAWRVNDTLCPHCLARYSPRLVDFPWGIDFTYYGCRECGQSREFLLVPRGVVAVLDNAWSEQQTHQDGLLRVNWLVWRNLFDFDWIEIVQATDEDVERFAVQIGNDTDPTRRGRYQEIPCYIAPSCHLSENTLRILRRMFGQVEERVALSARTRSISSSKLARLTGAVDDDAECVEKNFTPPPDAIKVD
jgi:hypothetical protein